MNIDIARRVRVSMSDAEVRRIVHSVIRRQEQKGFLPLSQRGSGRGCGISVAFISPQEMRRLNRTYHAEDRVTDVLAFGSVFLPLTSGGGARGGGELGELVICPTYVHAQAKRAGEPLRRELTRVLVHGTLHLLGYDHATPRDAEQMFGMQEEVVRRI